ncbi:hypothetical protein DOTSEDRAFT_50495 [Dothistroma septosporum NZE10]|uniref:Uncharacterized protein n=1 Tax=Dothistroma septosporum (strain NZE10 / CBS 128990) TaxID=675120 RepID=N1PU53_DOTSN|nr:hypothetical protein DOTSEDRAFT_50495 [Dothistroma septosporum NZE10]
MPNPFAWANDEENNGSYDTDDERPTDPRPRSQFLMAAPSQVNATAHWRPNSITWHGAAELIYGRPQHEHRLDPERPWWDMLEGDRDMMRLWDLAIQDLTPFDQMSPETRVWMLRALNEESLELLGVNTRAFQVPRRAAAPALDQSLFDPHMAMAIDWINRDHDYFDPAPFNELPSVVSTLGSRFRPLTMHLTAHTTTMIGHLTLPMLGLKQISSPTRTNQCPCTQKSKNWMIGKDNMASIGPYSRQNAISSLWRPTSTMPMPLAPSARTKKKITLIRSWSMSFKITPSMHPTT